MCCVVLDSGLLELCSLPRLLLVRWTRLLVSFIRGRG